jgi:hypothetical protein
MRPEDLLTDEFLKQFKNRDTLNDFLGQLQKRGIEKMPEGELDRPLEYDVEPPNLIGGQLISEGDLLSAVGKISLIESGGWMEYSYCGVTSGHSAKAKWLLWLKLDTILSSRNSLTIYRMVLCKKVGSLHRSGIMWASTETDFRHLQWHERLENLRDAIVFPCNILNCI